MCKEPHNLVIELCIRASKCMNMPHRMLKLPCTLAPPDSLLPGWGWMRLVCAWKKSGFGCCEAESAIEKPWNTTQTWVQCALKMDVSISDLRWFKYQVALQSIYFSSLKFGSLQDLLVQFPSHFFATIWRSHESRSHNWHKKRVGRSSCSRHSVKRCRGALYFGLRSLTCVPFGKVGRRPLTLELLKTVNHFSVNWRFACGSWHVTWWLLHWAA